LEHAAFLSIKQVLHTVSVHKTPVLGAFLGNGDEGFGFQMARKAGGNIRAMALDRKIDATQKFFLAAGCVAGSFILPAPVALLGLAGAGIFAYQGKQQIDSAARADQGAKGEEEIAQLLKQLPADWHCEYNRPVQGVGDIDVIVSSPNQCTWSIDVKSHKGTIFQEGDLLKKRMGRNVYGLGKDFLGAARKQASLLQQMDGLRWVTPVICFSAAQVDISRPVQGVYVVEKSQLLKFLLSR
jgi:Holliday junction resolvase-like predicted endonuclease